MKGNRGLYVVQQPSTTVKSSPDAKTHPANSLSTPNATMMTFRNGVVRGGGVTNFEKEPFASFHLKGLTMKVRMTKAKHTNCNLSEKKNIFAKRSLRNRGLPT